MKSFKLPQRKAKSKPIATGPAKLKSGWRLLLQTFQDFQDDWRRYIKILAVVAVPVNLIVFVPALVANSTVLAHAYLATLIMNAALIWAICQRQKIGQMPTVRQAYYDGSIVIVRFLLALFVIALLLVPAVCGIALYSLTILSVQVGGVIAGSEQLLMAVVAFIISTPTLYYLVRFSLAPVIAVRDGLPPVAALKLSRHMTIGKFWTVAARLLFLCLFVIAIFIPIMFISVVLSLMNLGVLGVFVFLVVATFSAGPIVAFYLLGLYRALEDLRLPKPNPTETAA